MLLPSSGQILSELDCICSMKLEKNLCFSPETLTERINQQQRRDRQNSDENGASNDSGNLLAPRMPLARRNGRRANGRNLRAPKKAENAPSALPLPAPNPVLVALDRPIPLIPQHVEQEPAPPRFQNNVPVQAEARALQDQALQFLQIPRVPEPQVEEIENVQPLEQEFEMDYGDDEQERLDHQQEMLEVIDEDNEEENEHEVEGEVDEGEQAGPAQVDEGNGDEAQQRLQDSR